MFERLGQMTMEYFYSYDADTFEQFQGSKTQKRTSILQSWVDSGISNGLLEMMYK